MSRTTFHSSSGVPLILSPRKALKKDTVIKGLSDGCAIPAAAKEATLASGGDSSSSSLSSPIDYSMKPSTSRCNPWMEDDIKCKICLEYMTREDRKPVTFPCKHSICASCYENTMEKSNLTCPFCRRRLSVWARLSTKAKKVIDEDMWKKICVKFPQLVNRGIERFQCEAGQGDHINGQADELDKSFEEQVEKICHDFAKPGEIREEFERELERERQYREEEKKKEEEESLRFIQENFADVDQSVIEMQDFLLARQLQEQLDREEEQKNFKRKPQMMRDLGVIELVEDINAPRPKRHKAREVVYVCDSDDDEYINIV